MAKERLFSKALRDLRERGGKPEDLRSRLGAGADILVVLSGEEEPLAAKLIETLELEEDSYDVVTRREEALEALWGKRYKCVYLSSSAIGTSMQIPDEFYDLFGGKDDSIWDRSIAAGLELAEDATRKGIPVVVGDEERRSKSAYEGLGAVVLNKLTHDDYQQYRRIKELINGD